MARERKEGRGEDHGLGYASVPKFDWPGARGWETMTEAEREGEPVCGNSD